MFGIVNVHDPLATPVVAVCVQFVSLKSIRAAVSESAAPAGYRPIVFVASGDRIPVQVTVTAPDPRVTVGFTERVAPPGVTVAVAPAATVTVFEVTRRAPVVPENRRNS